MKVWLVIMKTATGHKYVYQKAYDCIEKAQDFCSRAATRITPTLFKDDKGGKYLITGVTVI